MLAFSTTRTGSRHDSSAVTNYTSEANGNTLTDANHTNTWDSQNRMVSSLSGGKTSGFKYDTDGPRRKSSVTNSGQSTPTTITHFGYDGTNVCISGKRT